MNTFELKCSDWSAAVSADHGMNVFQLLYKNEPVLRSPEPRSKLNENAVVYGTPLLLPPDRTRNQKFTFEGIEYTLPNKMHGSICRTPMDIKSFGENYVEGEYINKDGTYPFPYKLVVKCVLDCFGLRQSFTFTNLGSGLMPLAFGLHTTFVAKDEFSVSLGQKWATDEEYFPSVLTSLPEDEIDITTGRAPQGYRLHGMYSDSGLHTATSGDFIYRVSPNFNSWVLWNMTGQEGFISLEPQNGPVNSLNMDGCCPVLKPDESVTYETLITHRELLQDPARCGGENDDSCG